MPTRPATWRREKVGSLSALAIRLVRKVSPKERSSLMVWYEGDTPELLRQAGGFAREASQRTEVRRQMDAHALRAATTGAVPPAA